MPGPRPPPPLGEPRSGRCAPRSGPGGPRPPRLPRPGPSEEESGGVEESGSAPALRVGRGGRSAAGALRAAPRSRPAGAARGDAGPGQAQRGRGRGAAPDRVPPLRQRRAARLCGSARPAPRVAAWAGGQRGCSPPSFRFFAFSFSFFFFFPLFRSPPSPPRYTRAVAPAGWPWQKNTSPHPKCTAARPGDECGRQQGARSAGQGCGGGGRAALRPRSAAARCGAPRSPPSRDVGAGLGLGASRVAGREGIERTEGFGGCPVGAGSGGVGGPAQWRGFLSEVAAVGSSALRDGPERRGSAGEGRRCCHRDVLCWCWSVDVQDSF